MKIDKIIGKNVRHFRKAHQYSQIELGQKLGLQQAAISRVENGTQKLTASDLHKLTKIFFISADILFRKEIVDV